MAAYVGPPTIISAYTFGGTNGKKRKIRELTITLATQGSVANPIPASALGFTYLEDCGNLTKSDNSVILPASPSYDGSMLVVGGGTANVPQDVTGTFSVTVQGW